MISNIASCVQFAVFGALFWFIALKFSSPYAKSIAALCASVLTGAALISAALAIQG